MFSVISFVGNFRITFDEFFSRKHTVVVLVQSAEHFQKLVFLLLGLDVLDHDHEDGLLNIIVGFVGRDIVQSGFESDLVLHLLLLSVFLDPRVFQCFF